jgi:hypothetical protein
MQTQTDPVIHPAAARSQAPAPGADAPRRSPVRTFARHYAEMLAAMFLGMFVLGFALAAPLELAGVDVSNWDTEAPALLLLAMAITMTVPMVAWMRHRGHGWAPAAEMTAAMFLPSFAAIGLLWSGIETDISVLLEIQHVAMFPSMLGVMLLRRHEYSGH